MTSSTFPRLSLYLICITFFAAGRFVGKLPQSVHELPAWLLWAQVVVLTALCVWVVRKLVSDLEFWARTRPFKASDRPAA